MENIISVRKDSPGYGTISKVMAAIQKQDYSTITRQDIDGALDAVAKSLAEKEGIPFAEAYAAVLTGDTGKALYNALSECPAQGVGPVVKREDDTVAKAESIECDAARLSASYGIPITEARQQVQAFYQNQK